MTIFKKDKGIKKKSIMKNLKEYNAHESFDLLPFSCNNLK